MAETISGIMGSQKQSQTTATSNRQSRKKRIMTAAKFAAGAVVLVTILNWFAPVWGGGTYGDSPGSARDLTSRGTEATRVLPLTDEQQALRLQREVQDAAVVAAAAAAARTAAAEVERQATQLTDAEAGPCLRTNSDKLHCQTVVFGFQTKYDREAFYDSVAGVGYCIVRDPQSAVEQIHLGGDQYRFIGREGLVAEFYDVPPGEQVGAVKCGS